MRSVLVGLMMMIAVGVMAGCGRSASAAEEAPVQAVAETSYTDLTSADIANRPVAPFKAPIFHEATAKRILPSRLVVPSIKVDTPIVELGWSTKKDAAGSVFSEWDVADFAAGWHKNSSLPEEPGNIVLSGHNNIRGAVFRELDQLKRGDEVMLYAGGKEYTYTVDEVLIVPEKFASNQQRLDNVRYIQETKDDRLTLVSCWPRNDNTHRIIVVAKPEKSVSKK